MANNNVRFFKVAKLQTYLDLAVKDANSLYWVDETQSLYLADKLYGIGQIATEEFAGLLSAEDYKKLQDLIIASGAIEDRIGKVEKKLDEIPNVYVDKKYEITDAPVGTLVNYYEKEIRIMCPNGAEYNLQNVGTGGDPNTYYVTFKTYVPSDDVVGYVEHLGGQSDADILKDIKTDEYGRRYQPTWLGVAKYDTESKNWSYYGKNSSVDHYIGWDYQIDWFDADNVMIASDNIRINLSNENCHNNSMPYYMNNYVTAEAIADLQASFTWTEF
jgi:hypothetical protein